MNKAKRILALVSALCLTATAVGCGSSGGSSSGSEETVTTHENQVTVEDNSVVDSMNTSELSEEDRTIRWMGTYDLNPTATGEATVEYQLFSEKGGKIEWTRVTDSAKFEKLAAAITAQQDVPDIFKYEWMAFPCQVTKNMYQPVDSIVDFDSELWSDVKAGADKFVLGGEHYVAPISYATGVVMMYNADVVVDEGLADPYELWLNGEWNWDTFREVMEDYVGNASGDETRYGVCGWFGPQIVQQTGETMVTYDGKHFTSNLMSPNIERAETFLYDLTKDGLVWTDWVNSAQDALNTMGNVMFYTMGTWAMTGAGGPKEGDNWAIVPIPADPTTNAKITTSDMTAYMWVKGSTKNQAVKTWLECAHIAATDEQYKNATKEKFFVDNPLWTEEMYNVLTTTASSEYDQVFDYGYGISALMSDDNSQTDGQGCVTRRLYENVTKTDEAGQQYTWSALRTEYSNTVDQELAAINDAIDAMES